MATLRPASAGDEPFLREMLAEAADWRPGVIVRSADEIMRDPGVAHYLAGWPLDDDFGVVAEDDGIPIGAAWCRFFDSEHHGYGFVAPDVPELTIAVVPTRRGGGTVRRLLEEMVREAERLGIERISLSVEAENPAVHLYSDLVFVEAARFADSPTMVLDCRTR